MINTLRKDIEDIKLKVYEMLTASGSLFYRCDENRTDPDLDNDLLELVGILDDIVLFHTPRNPQHRY